MAERRMSAGAGLLFKGSGFYLTDYGKNAHRTSGAAPKAGEGASSPSSDSTPAASSSTPAAESKPAAKAETKPAPAAPTPKSDK